MAPLVQGLNTLQPGGLFAPFEHALKMLQPGGFVAPLEHGLNAVQLGGFVALFVQLLTQLLLASVFPDGQESHLG